MILRRLLCDAVVNYFESDSWQELVQQMARGKEVRHAHAYADSILHPEPLLRIVAEYFKSRGLPLQRKIYVLPPANIPGMTDIYNIHPAPDWGHCELILRYSRDDVLTPMRTGTSLANKSVEVWDDAFMERFYTRFDFKTELTGQDEKDIIAYFDSTSWKLQSNFILGGTNRHAHALVETSIHPEIIQRFVIKTIEGRGWEVAKSVSIVYNSRGCDFGKITTLLKKPEIMLELEWEYNPDVSIRPGAEPMVLATTLEDLKSCMGDCDYIRLDEAAVQEIIHRLQANA